MIDAGAATGAAESSSAARPNASLRPGQWQGRYAQRYVSAGALDYFIATHIHPDHIGGVDDSCPMDSTRSFRLTGVSDVDAILPIAQVIDRGYPGYAGFAPGDAPFAANYAAYLAARRKAARPVSAVMLGSKQQFALRDRAAYPTFSMRALAANGRVVAGEGAGSRSTFPEPLSAEQRAQVTENHLSMALRLSYGRFSYFAGGDLVADTQDGRYPWLDVETPAVRAAGRTEVAAADHHGYFDACGPEFVRALAAQVYVVQAWDVGHPAPVQLERMLGAWNGRAEHDVFAMDLLPAARLVDRRFVPLMKSTRGHVVVRVARGGDTYHVFVIDSSVENGMVLAAFGPYTCRG